MVKKLKILKGLKGRSLEELRVRAAQKLASASERAGVSSQARVPADKAFFKLLDTKAHGSFTGSAEGLLEHFRTRERPHFFAAFNNREETVEELRRRFGLQAEERAVERAERIIEGRFDLLGFRNLSFGEPVDWHLEPVAGKRVPLRHWSRIDYLDADAAGDKKIIWELNRHQYFLTLGRAYWYTHDERYARTFTAHLADWMDKNPPKLGINWASSLEVAFRSISWLWALYFFKESVHLTPKLFSRALKFLYLHARHLETYLSTYFSPNTHLTGEALGLFYMGTLLPEFRRAGAWRATANRILMAELDRHVLPDGVYFEQTSYYHRYTTDFYTHLYILSEGNNEEAGSKLESKLTALLDHLMYITRPDSTTPLFGDDDGGRLLSLDERGANDFRATLSTGALLFNRVDYKQVAGELAEETLWLLGRDGASRFDRMQAQEPEHTSRAFIYGGYYVMRDGWQRDANYLLFDCGAHGTLNCGHAHADALSFDMASLGRTLLVDAGTYTYTGSRDARDLFRSSLAHNTLVVDGESSSVPAGAFSWKTVAQTRARRWITCEQFDFLEGYTEGYRRLPQPVTHTRSFLFIKNRYWVMRDLIETDGSHSCELRFHFAPGARPLIENDSESGMTVRAREAKQSGLELFTFGGEGEWHEEEGWVSSVYGAREAAKVCVFSANTKGAHEFITFLVPRRAEDAHAHVREIEVKGARAFEVLDDKERELLLIGEGGAAYPLKSDFEWTWARLGLEANDLKEFLLINGSLLCLHDKEVVKAESKVGYVAARRAGKDLIIERDKKGAPLTLASLGARRLILSGEEFAVSGEVIKLKDGFVNFEERMPLETFV